MPKEKKRVVKQQEKCENYLMIVVCQMSSAHLTENIGSRSSFFLQIQQGFFGVFWPQHIRRVSKSASAMRCWFGSHECTYKINYPRFLEHIDRHGVKFLQNLRPSRWAHHMLSIFKWNSWNSVTSSKKSLFVVSCFFRVGCRNSVITWIPLKILISFLRQF